MSLQTSFSTFYGSKEIEKVFLCQRVELAEWMGVMVCAVYVCAYKPMEDFAVSVKGIEREYDDVGIICNKLVRVREGKSVWMAN